MMARQFPTGLYTEGATVFDSQPFVNFYTQMQLRKQAKEEALDNYFRDFGKNITPTGMRNQDIPVLTQKNNEWRQFYSQNKPAILNPRLDGGKAYSEYMSRYQDQLGTIQQSKSLADTTKQLGQLRSDPKKSDLLTDEALENMGLHDLPINDPQHRAFNLNSLTYKPPPFDAKMREGVMKSLGLGLTPSEKILGQENLPNFQIKTTIGKEYTPEDLRVIGNRAKSFASSDKSIKNYAQSELISKVMSDPNKFGELNNIYKRVYGKDAQTPEDFFAAESILDLNRKSIKEDVKPDVYNRSMAMENMKHANAKKLIEYKKKIDPNDTELNNTWVESYLEQLKNEAQQGKPFEYKYSTGQKTQEYNIPVDPVLGKALSVSNVEPDAIRVDANGKFRRIFYKRFGKDEKGGVEGEIKMGPDGKVEVDETLSRPLLSKEQVALALGYKGQTKKQLEGTMQSALNNKPKTKTSFSIDGKSYTRKQLNDLGYDDNEIEDFIKQGIIK